MKTIIFIIITISLIISGCIENKEIVDLSMVQEQDLSENETAIKVAISSVISPKESIYYYEGLIQYISSKLGQPVQIVQRRTYKEINDLIKNGEIDFAFVCSGPYVEGNNEFGMKLLVVPEAYGRKTYYSYIIVPQNSNYTNLSDLRGKRFEGVAEGASVNSQIFEYMNVENPEIIQKTKIIEISQPFANPHLVVSGEIDPLFEQRLKDIFLNMDKDEEGKKILSSIIIDRFTILNDSNYDPIREMRNSLQ